MFVQYEVWGILDGFEELVECFGTLKEAEAFVEVNLEFHDEMYILEDTDEDLKEIRRYKGL
jgi:cob(I)alamin adenosyltransferase